MVMDTEVRPSQDELENTEDEVAGPESVGTSETLEDSNATHAKTGVEQAVNQEPDMKKPDTEEYRELQTRLSEKQRNFDEANKAYTDYETKRKELETRCEELKRQIDEDKAEHSGLEVRGKELAEERKHLSPLWHPIATRRATDEQKKLSENSAQIQGRIKIKNEELAKTQAELEKSEQVDKLGLLKAMNSARTVLDQTRDKIRILESSYRQPNI
jgi:chromosome segregation ATPase